MLQLSIAKNIFFSVQFFTIPQSLAASMFEPFSAKKIFLFYSKTALKFPYFCKKINKNQVLTHKMLIGIIDKDNNILWHILCKILCQNTKYRQKRRQ